MQVTLLGAFSNLTNASHQRSLHCVQLAMSLRPTCWLAGLAARGAQIYPAIAASPWPALHISDYHKPAAVRAFKHI